MKLNFYDALQYTKLSVYSHFISNGGFDPVLLLKESDKTLYIFQEFFLQGSHAFTEKALTSCDKNLNGAGGLWF